jgi:hypothetical protein
VGGVSGPGMVANRLAGDSLLMLPNEYADEDGACWTDWMPGESEEVIDSGEEELLLLETGVMFLMEEGGEGGFVALVGTLLVLSPEGSEKVNACCLSCMGDRKGESGYDRWKMRPDRRKD